MRTDGQTIRGNAMEMPRVKASAKTALTSERIAVALVKLLVAGYVGFFFARVIQAY